MTDIILMRANGKDGYQNYCNAWKILEFSEAMIPRDVGLCQYTRTYVLGKIILSSRLIRFASNNSANCISRVYFCANESVA